MRFYEDYDVDVIERANRNELVGKEVERVWEVASAPKTRMRPDREVFIDKDLSRHSRWDRSFGMTRSNEILEILLQSVAGVDSFPAGGEMAESVALVSQKPEIIGLRLSV